MTLLKRDQCLERLGADWKAGKPIRAIPFLTGCGPGTKKKAETAVESLP